MSNPFPYKCPIRECELHEKLIFAEKPQIRKHLVLKHDYKQYQDTAIECGLIDKIGVRSRGFFINLLCDFGISRGKTE